MSKTRVSREGRPARQTPASLVRLTLTSSCFARPSRLETFGGLFPPTCKDSQISRLFRLSLSLRLTLEQRLCHSLAGTGFLADAEGKC